MAATDATVSVSVTPETAKVTEQFAAIGKVFADMGQTLSEAAKKVFGPALQTVLPTPVQGDYALWPGQIAKAFDVPLMAVAPELCVNHSPYVPAEKALNHLGINAYLHQQQHQTDYSAQLHKLKVAAEAMKPATMTVKYEDISPELWKTLLGEPYPFKPQSPITQLAVDLAVYGNAYVALHEDGSISTIDPTEVVVDMPHKHFEPPPEYLEGDGDPWPKLKAHQVFYAIGEAQPIVVSDHVSSPAVDFDKPMPVQEGKQFTTMIGEIWEWRKAGGWRLTNSDPFNEDHAPHGWFCTYCWQHLEVHGGDPVACESGGWLRPATAVEHKRALLAL